MFNKYFSDRQSLKRIPTSLLWKEAHRLEGAPDNPLLGYHMQKERCGHVINLTAHANMNSPRHVTREFLQLNPDKERCLTQEPVIRSGPDLTTT